MGHRRWLMLGWLLAALAALARGGTTTAPGFSCWKECSPRRFLCSWPPHGPAGNTSYVLTLCYTTRRLCQRFEAGARTTYVLSRHRIYVLTNATAWVEAHWGGHVHRTPNLTLYLNEAVKLDPPLIGMPFTKTASWLRDLADARNRIRPGFVGITQAKPWIRVMTMMDEIRPLIPSETPHSWGPPTPLGCCQDGPGAAAMVMCEAVTGEDESVTCALGGASAVEVQLRHKLPHWSSYWSDWSSSILIPEEILASPALSHQLGKLGRDGQRVLRLGWQRTPVAQGNVTYTLLARMTTCPCTEPAQENIAVHDIGFMDVSVAGGTVMAQWEALSSGLANCFEQQPLAEAPKSICVQQDFSAKSIHVETGVLDTPACYRFAVHGWAPAQGWATFALQHHYASNASLAVPIHIDAGAEDDAVVLQWSPSPRAACPGALAKYLLCHAAEGDNVTYTEVDATASHYTLQNLQPGTIYRVGVREVTVESGGTCGPWWYFQTKTLGPQGAAWKSHLKYLGLLLCLPIMAAVYQLSKKRARHLLFPPLPKPVGSKAVYFATSETSQGLPRPGFVEPSERFSPAELLIPELGPSKETTDVSTCPSTPQPGSTAEKPVVVGPADCGEDEEEEEEEEEEEGRPGLRQLLVPIALLISDKPIIIRDGKGWDPVPEESVP
ncbi:PREDICTED: interleukin-12 receptor subunit beta-1 [Mesitornis unicolor]|uniref:interleukin-12 receptor subunit beta-1 n=1 Tax=Mesitornis unicolor TaxID=54374 RepID=UPI000528CD6F|nr:PREDICTED: interleukin-12 receptor subunit beta-1 [Mesitornis unicolor]